MGGKLPLRKNAPLSKSHLVFWFVRRLLAPFVLGTVVCAAFFLIWVAVTIDGTWHPTSRDIVDATVIIFPFEAVGLILLVPIAFLLFRSNLRPPLQVVLLIAVGSAVGALVAGPLFSGLSLLQFSLPATCGALSALVWTALNRDLIRR